MSSQSTTAPPFFFDTNHVASPASVPATQTALILADYHNVLIASMGPTGPNIVANATQFRDFALAKGVTVIHALMDVDRGAPERYKSAHVLPQFRGMKAHSPAMLAEAATIAPKEGSGEIVAYRAVGAMSALRSDGVRELLEGRGIKSIIICGLTTTGVVMRTAVPAADEGFIITVLEDACADNKPGAHELIMQGVLLSQAHIISTAQAIEEFDRVW